MDWHNLNSVGILILISCSSVASLLTNQIPVVITTWSFDHANIEAFKILNNKGSAVDAVEAGSSACEEMQCDYTVGYGGSPDENGETTLDAMIMDGDTINVGAVGGLRRIKSAAAVARMVLDYTGHSLLVGDLATEFALKLGFKEEPLYTNHSITMQQAWESNYCQPNFWENVKPDPKQSCGPYSPMTKVNIPQRNNDISSTNHDTIGIAAIDSYGKVAAGTSSNGAAHKIPGRVGDAPIPGAGCYADSSIGAAAATGDGDVMMRFLPSFVAVDEMRRGALPQQAAEIAIERITSRYPNFVGAVVVLRKDGKFGAACHGLPKFPYTVSNPQIGTQNIVIPCE